MEKIAYEEVLTLDEYERQRPSTQPEMIALRGRLRVTLGPIVSLAFEERRTLLYQVQEMMRAERITSPEGIQTELDTYNSLVPQDGELVATLLIEITDQAELKRRLPQLVGIEHAVSIRVGSVVVGGSGEGGRSTAETTSSVHYLRFPVSSEAVAALRDASLQAHVVIDHAAYQAWTEVSSTLRGEMLRILGE